jgi:hypothetical protein
MADTAGSESLFAFLSTDTRKDILSLPSEARSICHDVLKDALFLLLVDISGTSAGTAPPPLSPQGAALLAALTAGKDAAFREELAPRFARVEQTLLVAAGAWGSRRAASRPGGQRVGADAIVTERRPRRPARAATALEDYVQISPAALTLFAWHAGQCLTGTLRDAAPGRHGELFASLVCDDGAAVPLAVTFPAAADELASGDRVAVLDPYFHINRFGERLVSADHAEDLLLLRAERAPEHAAAAFAARRSKGAALIKPDRSVVCSIVCVRGCSLLIALFTAPRLAGRPCCT